MHMTIGQMAREAGVSTRTLRHYEEQGLLAPQRTDAGYRCMTRRTPGVSHRC